MDIIARSVLQFVQQEYKNAVIAGGAARDEYIGLAPKDYDIIVSGQIDITGLQKEFNVKGLEGKSRDYSVINPKKKPWGSDGTLNTISPRTGKSKYPYTVETSLVDVIGFEIEDRKFDLLVYSGDKNDDEYVQKVLNKFNFGINMIYYDGNSLDDTNPNFIEDINCATISLLNINSISELPRYINKYNSMNDRFMAADRGMYSFRAPCLQIIGKKTSDTLKIVTGGTGTTWVNDPLVQAWDNAINNLNGAPAPQVFLDDNF